MSCQSGTKIDAYYKLREEKIYPFRLSTQWSVGMSEHVEMLGMRNEPTHQYLYKLQGPLDMIKVKRSLRSREEQHELRAPMDHEL